MATQVPYSGTQSISPQFEPLAQVHENTPEAAFGGAVAGAVTHMGEIAEGAGKELFARGYAMQELNQQDQANAAVAAYQNELTQSYVDYTRKQGQDAIHALPDFASQTEQLRQKYAGSLNSPYAIQQFNQESRNARFRMVFSAGTYAREEMRKFSNEAAASRIDATSDRVAIANSHGYDPVATKQGLDEAASVARQDAIARGFKPGTPEFDEQVRMGTSRVATSTARELAKRQPQQADQFAKDALRDGHMTSTDAQNLQPIIEQHKLLQGTRATGGAVLSGQDPVWDKTSIGSERALEVLSKSSGTGGYETIGREDPQGNGHAVGKYGVPSSELSRWLSEAGMPAEDEDAFLKDHAAQDKLAGFKFDQLQKQYGSAPEAMKAWAAGIDTSNRVMLGRKAIADTASHTEIAAASDRASEREAPGDGAFKDFTQAHVDNTRARNERFLEEDNRQNAGIVSDALLGIKNQNGKLPTSLAELFADPNAREAYDKLNPKEQFQVGKALQRNISRGGYDFTIKSQAQFERLYGISVDPNSTVAERKELIDVDAPSLQMPLEARIKIRQAQQKVVNGAAADPQMGHALAVMQPMLNAYGMTKAQDPDRYNSFVGAFHDAMQGFGEGRLKAVKSDDDIKQIGSRLLRDMPKAHFWNSTQKYFEAPPADNKSTQLATEALTKQLGRPPTDEEVARLLLRAQFQATGGDVTKMDKK